MKTKTQFTNRILSFVLSIMMVVSMLPMNVLTASAAEGDKVSVTIGGETTYYTSIIDAVAKANESDNATITLLQDTTTGERLDITKSTTLDLNGNTLSCATNFSDDYDTMVAVTANGAKLTIIDSIGGGKLDGTGTTFVLYLGEPSWQGAVTFTSSAQISGGTVSGGVRMRGGTSMTVSGGTLENNTDGLATIEMQSETTLNVSGGEILNTVFAGDAISNMDGGTVIISGGTVNASGDYARAIRTQNSGGVEISGGNIFGAQYDLSFGSDDTVELAGGTFPGGITIYGKTLNESLGNGFSYWAVVGGQNTMLTVATDATGITDKGDITIRATCNHSGNTNDYTDNGDGTHDKACSDCGDVVVNNENHILTYTVDGNTITVSCSANCGYSGTATISATGKTYDGNAVEVVVSKTGSLENTDIPVTLTKDGEAFTGEPVNAGAYSASVTLGDKTVSVNFTIAKAEVSIATAPTPNTLTYTGDAQILIAPGEVVGGTMVYSLTENGEYTTSIPQGTNAGDYTVWYYVQGDANHNDSAKDSVAVTIKKATVTVTADPKTKAYGDAEPKLTYTVNGLFGEDKLTGALSRTEGENAGKYAITQGTLAAGDNYTISFTGAELTIIDVTAPTGTILIKENSWNKFWNTITFGIFCKDYVDVTITADGTGSGVTKVEYLLSGTVLEENNIPVDGWTTLNADNGKYSFSIKPQNKVAVYVRITDEGNNVTVINSDGIVVYEDSEAVDTEVTYTYKENSNKDIAVEFNGNTVKSILCGEKTLAANSDYTVDYESGKIVLKSAYLDTLNAGDYTFTVSYNPMGVENSGVTDLTTTFIVKVEPISIDGAAVNVSGTFTYDGHAKTPDPVVVLNGETLVKDRDYTVSYAENVNAGTATVTVTGKGNYSGTASGNFAIGRAELTDVSVQQNGKLTYNGQAQTPTVFTSVTTVDGSKVTFTYGTEMEGLYSAEIPSFTNVGWAHTVYYRATADNHNTYYGIFLVEIEKAIVTEPTIASKPYTGSVQTADVPASDLYTVEENNGGIGVLENGKGYNVVLKLEDPENYKWSTTDNAQVTLPFAITRAENEWAVNPSISGWTYGETANEPVGEAKFGEVSVEYSGTTNGGATYSSTTAPTEAGSYKATFTVQETEDYSALNTSVDFTIAKADQAAPTGLTKTDTTYFGKADGKISGLTSAMEFRKEGDSTYTAGFNGTLEYLAAGTYYVRYQGDANHNPSPDAVVNVNDGRKLQIVVPQNQVGYTVTVNKTEMEYEGSYTLKVEIHEGYTATEDFKIIISNWECGQQAGVEETYMNAIADQIIEVRGVADITPPAAEIKVKENKWTSFWNNLTFGLFFKETQDVTITAADKGSGVKSIQYYLSNGELELDEVKAISDWVDYNGTFKIDPNNYYVVYAKITDHAGNILYINSDGIVLDNIAPTLDGIEDGKTYYGDLTVIKSDEQFYDIKMVTLDGEPMGFAEGTYGLIPADNAEHIVVVEDHAGNKTTYTVTVMKNYTVTYKADGEPFSTETVGHGKDANLPAVPAKNGYVGKWDSDGKNITGDTTITVVYTEIPVVKPNEVKSENKTDLEDTKAKLEEELKDDSYTDEDKKNIQDAIDDIDDALEVIGNVEAVEESIVKLPAVNTVKPDDEEAIKAITDAQTAYNALSDYEKSLVDEATKATLDKLVAALVAYDIVEGDGSSWTEDSNHNITFVVNGLFSKFVGIKVDGKDVDKANYEAKAGSTIITLKTSYLDTLAVGEHTITVVYTDGSTDGTFNVHAKAHSLATGDNSNMFLWIALLFISGGAVITLTVVDRKKRMASKR